MDNSLVFICRISHAETSVDGGAYGEDIVYKAHERKDLNDPMKVIYFILLYSNITF